MSVGSALSTELVAVIEPQPVGVVGLFVRRHRLGPAPGRLVLPRDGTTGEAALAPRRAAVLDAAILHAGGTYERSMPDRHRGRGFIGRRLLGAARARGCRVIGLDRAPPPSDAPAGSPPAEWPTADWTLPDPAIPEAFGLPRATDTEIHLEGKAHALSELAGG